MIYGYARVSTRAQIQNNSIEEQTKLLKEAKAETIIIEAYTGTTINRPEFNKLINELKPGDILIVTKLDRLCRSATEGTKLIQELIAREITVKILNMGTISSKPVDKLLLTMMLAFAEFERDLIYERTQEGKRIARLSPNYREGRPRIPKSQTDHALTLLKNHSYKQVSDLTGISISTLQRRKREAKEASYPI